MTAAVPTAIAVWTAHWRSVVGRSSTAWKPATNKAVAIYIALLPFLGFRIATALFVAGFQVVLERPTTLRQWAIQLAIAVGTAAVTYLVFERYLSVILPRGSWTGW